MDEGQGDGAGRCRCSACHDLAVIGTNYRTEHTPGWVYKLEADPTATVEYRGRNVEGRARPADAAGYDTAFRCTPATPPTASA